MQPRGVRAHGLLHAQDEGILTDESRDRSYLWVASAIAVTVVHSLALLNPSVAEIDPEELYNAGVAWMIAHGHAEALFRMQYREYCGGCSLNAVIGAPLLALLGPRWLAWKLVPLAFSVFFAAAGTRLVQRTSGRQAALCFTTLLVLSPRAWQHLSLIGWGNHVEAGIVGTIGLLMATGSQSRRRRLLAGVLLGAAVWISFSGLFAPVAAMVVLGLRRDPRAVAQVALGVPLGLLPWIIQYTDTGLHPFVTIYQEGESAPVLSRIPYKLGTLLRPTQLAALFGGPWGIPALVLGVLAAGSVGTAAVLSRHARDGVGFVACVGIVVWTAIYTGVRFQIYDPLWPEIAVPGSVRYAAPLFPLIMVLVADVAGRLWSSGRRATVLMLVLPLCIGGLLSRVETLSAMTSPARIWGLTAVHWEHFRPQFSYTLPTEEHLSSATDDALSRRAHSYALGRNDAGMKLRNPQDGTLRRVRRPDTALSHYWWEGIGEALVDQLDDESADTVQLLQRADVLLDGAPEISIEGRRAALRAAAWARREQSPDLDPTWLQHRPTPPSEPSTNVREAIAFMIGRDTAQARSGWHGDVPTDLLPEVLGTACPGELCSSSVEGIAFGLAAELGPAGVRAVPVPEVAAEAWRDGVRAGLDLWWPNTDKL